MIGATSGHRPNVFASPAVSTRSTMWDERAAGLKEVITITIDTVKTKYESQLMRLPNVTGVGIGDKAGNAVIKVFVTHKLPESALKPGEVVPKSLDGYATDVEPIGLVTHLR